ncbi:pleiotropic regulatory protein RsmS [Vibrio gallicus]|uniref:pleiotropic regulatory protein RsmS n=1 Tax=Vibrio gallicus TaxID=190897 RepID=UPI0036F23351
MADNNSPLDNAPSDVKLAVDLIYLLESNDISPEIALSALEIVKQDLQRKKQANDSQR